MTSEPGAGGATSARPSIKGAIGWSLPGAVGVHVLTLFLIKLFGPPQGPGLPSFGLAVAAGAAATVLAFVALAFLPGAWPRLGPARGRLGLGWGVALVALAALNLLFLRTWAGWDAEARRDATVPDKVKSLRVYSNVAVAGLPLSVLNLTALLLAATRAGGPRPTPDDDPFGDGDPR